MTLFLGIVDTCTDRRRMSAVFEHLRKRLAAVSGVQQHLEVQNYHSIYLRVTKIDVIRRKT